MPDSRRIIVSFRAAPIAWQYIGAMARKAGMSRSEMARQLLGLGVKHAPKDWRP